MRDVEWTPKELAAMDQELQDFRRKNPNHPTTLRGIAAEKAWDEGERAHQEKQSNSPRK